MKRIIAVILSVLMLATMLVACDDKDKETLWGQDWAYVGYGGSDAFYFGALNRDKLSTNSVKHLPIYKFDTLSELEQFKENFKDDFSFNRTYDDEESFEMAIEGIDETYFNQYRMYLVYVSSNSGSYRYVIDNVVSEGEHFCIYVKQINNPENVTDDMAGWFVLFAQPKSDVKDYATYDAQMAQ